MIYIITFRITVHKKRTNLIIVTVKYDDTKDEDEMKLMLADDITHQQTRNSSDAARGGK